jgi:5-methylcytosine-specific restriction protein A
MRTSNNAAPTERLRGRAAVAQRKRRMQRTYGLCEDCQAKGLTKAAHVVDHIIPLAHGGSDEDENTRNLCHEHHQQRTAEQFGHKPKVKIGLDGWRVG